MGKFSVCIDLVFKEKDFCRSLNVCKETGFDTIEFWSWWDKDLEKIQQTTKELGLTISTFCTKFYSLTDETKREDYIQGLKESIGVAKKLGVKLLISQAGDDIGLGFETQKQSIIEGLKCCKPLLEESGITLLLEPLNTVLSHPTCFLSSSDVAFDIIDEVSSEYVKVLFDIYHQQITEGNILYRIRKNIDKIGHFHVSGVPERDELDCGELNYKFILDEIEKLDYQGYLGLEYKPVNPPEQGLLEIKKTY